LQQVADIAVCVPSTETPLIQELHMILLHLLCDVVEAQLAADEHGRLAQ
jgi:D-sedoheptulose 7-phosphate isomerase